MFQVTSSNSLSIVTELCNELCNDMSHMFAAEIAEAKGEAGLKMVEDIASGLTLVAAAVSLRLAAADAHATALRAEVRDEALARIVLLLNSGSVTLADITSRLAGPAVVEPTVTVLPVVESVVALPAVEAVPDIAEIASVVEFVESLVVAEVPALAQPVETPKAQPVVGMLVPTQRLTAPYKYAVKFFDPASGAGWSGRGPMPKWFSDLLVNGKTKEDFRVVAQAPTPFVTAPEALVEPQSEAELEIQVELEAEAVAKAVSESGPQPEAVVSAESVSESESESEADPVVESAPQAAAEALVESESESEPEAAPVVESESQPEAAVSAESESRPEAVPAVESAPQAVAEGLAESEFESEAVPVTKAAVPVVDAGIGADVSFDADFDFDEVIAPAKRDDDIGEFIVDFAQMSTESVVSPLIAP